MGLQALGHGSGPGRRPLPSLLPPKGDGPLDARPATHLGPWDIALHHPSRGDAGNGMWKEHGGTKKTQWQASPCRPARKVASVQLSYVAGQGAYRCSTAPRNGGRRDCRDYKIPLGLDHSTARQAVRPWWREPFAWRLGGSNLWQGGQGPALRCTRAAEQEGGMEGQPKHQRRIE